MHTEEKRFFLGNLPPNVTEEYIFKKFKKCGVVKSVEIKHRPDNSTFAFLNFEGNKNAVDSCKFFYCHKVKQGFKKIWKDDRNIRK